MCLSEWLLVAIVIWPHIVTRLTNIRTRTFDRYLCDETLPHIIGWVPPQYILSIDVRLNDSLNEPAFDVMPN